MRVVPFSFLIKSKAKDPFVSIIGCGQFAFSTISFFLRREKGNRFLNSFDIDCEKSTSLASFYKFKHISTSFEELLSNPELKLLYISSNHATHSYYALKAIEKNVPKIYVEKPLSTNIFDFEKLISVITLSQSEIFVGYNRPFSKAILLLKEYISNHPLKSEPLSINYFISGHLIEKDHWYRNEGEGTRVCGNLGHWLDLTIHIFYWRKILPDLLTIDIVYSNIDEPDDNVIICIKTDLGDIVSIMLSSRAEPFEGINETINLQYSNIIAKIDDFRKLKIWQDEKYVEKKYYPKDVGHKLAILQPFRDEKRNWNEVELSTILMLRIMEVVQSRKSQLEFNIGSELHYIENLKK